MTAKVIDFVTREVLQEPKPKFGWMLRKRCCKACGSVLDPPHGKPGPERSYCGSACRSRAYRERQRNG